MADIEVQVTIARPISDVYKAAVDYEDSEGLKKWQPDLVNIGITAGDPIRSGSMIAMTRRFLGASIFVNADVLEVQRNKRIELQGIHGRFRFRREIEFTPDGRSTKINDKITFQTGVLFFWYRPILLGAFRRQTEREWQNLKKILEA